jgi:hypothetical protein
VKTSPELLRDEAQAAEAVVTCTEYNRRYMSAQIGPAGRAYLVSGGHLEVPAALPFYKAVFWLKGRTTAIRTKAVGWREQAEIMFSESLRNIADGLAEGPTAREVSP